MGRRGLLSGVREGYSQGKYSGSKKFVSGREKIFYRILRQLMSILTKKNVGLLVIACGLGNSNVKLKK